MNIFVKEKRLYTELKMKNKSIKTHEAANIRSSAA